MSTSKDSNLSINDIAYIRFEERNRIISNMKSILKNFPEQFHSRKRYRIATDICNLLKKEIKVPKLEKRIPDKITKQDAMKILEVVDNYPYQCSFLRFRNYAIFSTFIYTGIRKKELLNLKYTDVDIENIPSLHSCLREVVIFIPSTK